MSGRNGRARASSSSRTSITGCASTFSGRSAMAVVSARASAQNARADASASTRRDAGEAQTTHQPSVSGGVGIDYVEGRRRCNDSHRGDRLHRLVLVDQGGQIQIGETVGVIAHEGAHAVDMIAYATQPFADLAVEAGIDEGDAPAVEIGIEQLHIFATLGHDKVVAEPLFVLEEVLLDLTVAVAEPQDEVVLPEVG